MDRCRARPDDLGCCPAAVSCRAALRPPPPSALHRPSPHRPAAGRSGSRRCMFQYCPFVLALFIQGTIAAMSECSRRQLNLLPTCSAGGAPKRLPAPPDRLINRQPSSRAGYSNKAALNGSERPGTVVLAIISGAVIGCVQQAVHLISCLGRVICQTDAAAHTAAQGCRFSRRVTRGSIGPGPGRERGRGRGPGRGRRHPSSAVCC